MKTIQLPNKTEMKQMNLDKLKDMFDKINDLYNDWTYKCVAIIDMKEEEKEQDMHRWGDSWFKKYGKDLNYAIYYCMKYWKQWARIGSHGKEKWGRFDQYPCFWDGGLHGLIWPGYVRIVSPILYWYIDRFIIKPITKCTRLHWLGRQYQYFIYYRALNKMLKKFPYIKHELCIEDWEPRQRNK